MATTVDVAICVGKSCRKRPEYAELWTRLGEAVAPGDGTLLAIGCSGICSGPVVVVDATAGQRLVLARVRSPKARRDVVRMVIDGDRPSRRLRERSVGGRKRVTALGRVARARARTAQPGIGARASITSLPR